MKPFSIAEINNLCSLCPSCCKKHQRPLHRCTHLCAHCLWSSKEDRNYRNLFQVCALWNIKILLIYAYFSALLKSFQFYIFVIFLAFNKPTTRPLWAPTLSPFQFHNGTTSGQVPRDGWWQESRLCCIRRDWWSRGLNTGWGFGGEEEHEDFERSCGSEESHLGLSSLNRQTKVDSQVERRQQALLHWTKELMMPYDLPQ